MIAGRPGAGKSIFAHQLLFNYLHEHAEAKVLYLTTLSEPPAKIIRYMRAFDFFDADLFQTRFQLEDIGLVIREESLEPIADELVHMVQKVEPSLLVIDSFKAIRDLTSDLDSFRRFVYQVAIRFYGQQCTTFLVGEYPQDLIAEGAEFAVADGIFAPLSTPGKLK